MNYPTRGGRTDKNKTNKQKAANTKMGELMQKKVSHTKQQSEQKNAKNKKT